jgi:hypothetical protein
MTPCSLLDGHQIFGGTYPLHLKGRSDNLHGGVTQRTTVFTAVKTSSLMSDILHHRCFHRFLYDKMN